MSVEINNKGLIGYVLLNQTVIFIDFRALKDKNVS